jgi:RNA polymerase sigma-70 factor (ECF subfamily)
MASAVRPEPLATASDPDSSSDERELEFLNLYRKYFSFAWRNMRRLGIAVEAIDDAVQEVFVVVYRRLEDRTELADARSWMYGIIRRVASDHRRAMRRKPSACSDDLELLPNGEPDPLAQTERTDALRLLYTILSELQPSKREVFILAELEQMSAPEISDALQIPLNTVYSRLRMARQELEHGLKRHRARQR